MKVLIILAVLLLVPLVMKLQMQTLRERSAPQTQREILAALQAEGVAQPWVKLDYLAAEIGGSVASQREAEAVAKRVTDLRGVTSVRNQLAVAGEILLARKDGNIRAKGLVPVDWREVVFANNDAIDLSALKTKAGILFPHRENPAAWGLLIDHLFQVPGERSLQVKGPRLILRGEAVPSHAEKTARLLARFGAVEVETSWDLLPSEYHFPARSIESSLEGEPLRSLRRQLSEQVFSFQENGGLVEGGQLSDLAATLVTFPQVSFVIGGYPQKGQEQLAEARAKEVQRRLVAAGVSASNLRVVPFEMTEDRRGLAGQVELLVR